MLVLNTSTIQGFEIIKYFQPITSHLVTGTNLFSDFGASLTDIFGGRSETYQKKIADLYTDAVDELKTKAEKRGANCILGLSIDLDEISGKGKSMFMITAIGTPVLLNMAAGVEEIVKEKRSFVALKEIEDLNKAKRLRVEMEKNKSYQPSNETWEFFKRNKLQSGVIAIGFTELCAAYNGSSNVYR